MGQAELPPDRARRLVAEIALLQPDWLIVEGGEPLLRRDLFELLGAMREQLLEVHLITNGLLLNPRTFAALKELGIKVMISIDGATAATYQAIRRGSDFGKAMDQVRNCVQSGLLEAINFTVLKSNYQEIPGIFDLAAYLGVPKINFIGFKPCQGHSVELLSPEQCAQAIRLACRGAQATGLDFFFDEPFFWAAVKEWGLSVGQPSRAAGILSPATTACIFGEYLFIGTDGEVKPCSFAPLVVDNVAEKSLVEIWQEMRSSSFFRRVADAKTRKGACRDCRYREQCKGCRSRTFMLTGDWFSADPYCPLNIGRDE
jgi:radical SAM protein with 4Fe4S-binding SPASM domain